MKKVMLFACAVLVIYGAFSCQNNLDDLHDIEEANMTFEGQFKAIWTALNFNYPIWDYEEEKYGLNWDSVYQEYLPKFKELDEKRMDVSDFTIWMLYTEIMNKLHDGHIYLRLRNCSRLSSNSDIFYFDKVWRRSENISPQFNRNTNRILNDTALTPNLSYYYKTSDKNKIVEYTTTYNHLTQYCRFSDDILYFYFRSFNFTHVFNDIEKPETDKECIAVWEKWFNSVQELHNNGGLKGIIIDLRNNEGGTAEGYKYILGALHGANSSCGNFSLGYLRHKTSVGRHDYSALTPWVLPIYPDKHANVTVPIVVLADLYSSSMAEITCLAAKKLPNACVIGTKTWGCFSPLTDTANSNAITYRGNIGDPELQTISFYIKMPTAAFLSDEKEILEGNGVEPDIEVVLDRELLKEIGRDNQIERALEYIRTGR